MLEHARDLFALSVVQRRKRRPAFVRELDQALAAIRVRWPARDEAITLELGKDAAQVPRVDAQIPAQLRRRRSRAVGKFVKNAHFYQGKWAAQESLIQDPHPLRVEPVEAPD